MERNLIQRVEVAFPIDSEVLKERLVEECFTLPWQDDMVAWDMRADGSYALNSVDSTVKYKHLHKKLLKHLRA